MTQGTSKGLTFRLEPLSAEFWTFDGAHPLVLGPVPFPVGYIPDEAPTCGRTGCHWKVCVRYCRGARKLGDSKRLFGGD